jgi:CubicO group peptidase (beta-lactamase class C family)
LIINDFQTSAVTELALHSDCCLLATVCHARDRANPKVDKLFAQWDRADSPGAAVVIVKGGTVVYQRGYGYANLEHHIPITPQTSFDVASVAKQFLHSSNAFWGGCPLQPRQPG